MSIMFIFGFSKNNILYDIIILFTLEYGILSTLGKVKHFCYNYKNLCMLLNIL